MKIEQSENLYQRALFVTPGGVNSPVRAFKGVGGTPRFIARGEGAYVFDVDNNRYTDYVLSWGPLVLGHAHPSVVEAIEKAVRLGTSFGAPTEAEVQLAEFIVELFPSIDMVRLVSSGTEATMSAVRLARAFTGRNKIIKFSGGFHGHADILLAEAGSGLATLSLPSCAGVPIAVTADTIVVRYNDLHAVREVFEKNSGQIAGIIVEPIAGNIGFALPNAEFLPGISALCKEHEALLIFDEVMTGFRAAWPGTQAYYNIVPDITCLGKVIGGGLPIAAYGGRQEIMEKVSPLGAMYQSGTLSGNPLSTAAGIATLKILECPTLFSEISKMTLRLIEGIQYAADVYRIRVQASCMGSMFGVYFLNKEAPELERPITNYEEAKKYVHSKRYAQFFHEMLNRGHYFAPSAFEASFLSAAHTVEDIENTLDAVHQTFKIWG
jgi:glutamate-1-semialdehyde 2,1-aminomutase